MAQTTPWISFHAPWKSRAKSGLIVLDQIERFLAAVAVDPAPDSADLTIVEDHGEAMRRATRELPSTHEHVTRALAAIDYRPGPLVEDAQRRFGPGAHAPWASGATGFLFAWKWARSTRPVDAAAFVDFYRTHERLPAIGAMSAVDVTLTYWFDVKRPGTTAPLYPGSDLRSSVMVWLGSKRVNLSVRYDTPDFTPELRTIHGEIVAALGPKTPRHALQQIIPARGRGRERRIPIG